MNNEQLNIKGREFLPIKTREDYYIYLESDLDARKLDQWKRSYKVFASRTILPTFIKEGRIFKDKEVKELFLAVEI
ncbi:hypothetical protein GCM10020331_024090 [Ectobacillus funiculus]